MINSIPCLRMEYPPNPAPSFEYLVRGYDCHLLRSVRDSFVVNFVSCAFSGETETIFESLRSSIEKQDRSIVEIL